MGFSVQAPEQSHAPASTTSTHVDEQRHPSPHVLDGATVAAASQIGASGLGANENHGTRLNSFWNHLFGGPDQLPNDGKQNHIGPHQGAGPFDQGHAGSNAIRNIPYIGDYVEALSRTHDAAGFTGAALPLTAFSNVLMPAPVMGLVDAPFRLFGHSLFLDK